MNTRLHPPKRARKLLEHLIDRDIRYSAMGDFDELYALVREERGRFRADVWYWIQIIRSTPRFVKDRLYWRIVMFRNYLLIALRHIRKYKAYASPINISGSLSAVSKKANAKASALSGE